MVINSELQKQSASIKSHVDVGNIFFSLHTKRVVKYVSEAVLFTIAQRSRQNIPVPLSLQFNSIFAAAREALWQIWWKRNGHWMEGKTPPLTLISIKPPAIKLQPKQRYGLFEYANSLVKRPSVAANQSFVTTQPTSVGHCVWYEYLIRRRVQHKTDD